MPGGSTGAPPGMGGVSAGSANASSGSQITMEALENLFDRKLGAVRYEIEQLKIQDVCKKDFEAGLAPLSKDVNVLKGEMKQIDAGLRTAQATAEAAKASVEAIRNEFEQRIQSMNTSIPATPQSRARHSTVLFEGFENGFETACEFINSELDKAKIQRPSTQFYKGDEFKGQVFCKFPEGQAADHTLTTFSARPLQHDGVHILCKPDLPIDKRVCLSFILGLRRQLIKWGFERYYLKVEDSIPMLGVSGQPVVKVTVNDGKIDIEWMDSTWANWSDLLQTPEFVKLTEDNNKRLSSAVEYCSHFWDFFRFFGVVCFGFWGSKISLTYVPI